MKRSFYTIMAAQFFSSLADNALFVLAVELLKDLGGGEWQRAALVPMFALFYVLLAPIVGAYADYRPKGQVMFISNGIKVLGCAMMLFGVHPILAYAVVGLGAAAYSPAKYGILTELLPPSELVKANGWIEGLTIASIILGVMVGGLLLRSDVSTALLALDLPLVDLGLSTAPMFAIACMTLLYGIAAWFNTRIPRTNVALRPLPKNLVTLIKDFSDCNTALWRDKLGQISLATTTLFWGVSGNLRYIVLAWGAAALGYSTSQSSALVGVVAIGTAVGAVVASVKMKLESATKVMPLGIAMGVLVTVMVLIRDVGVAVPFLIVLGGIGGFLVVSMNALLQHRGHSLMGAGRSIAVQNFNEQASILLLGALYTGLTSKGMSAFMAILVFGALVAGLMAVIQTWHRRNLRHYPVEIAALNALTRGHD